MKRSVGVIVNKILIVRGCRIMLDVDLAAMYGVSTKVLNQAVKRNKARFPTDFMFVLTKHEKKEVVTNCDHLRVLKYSPTCPYAFTEHGVLMAANLLNSRRAVEMSLAIVRVFVRLREMLSAHKILADKIDDLERKVRKSDGDIRSIFHVLRTLVAVPEKPRRLIGFHAERK